MSKERPISNPAARAERASDASRRATLLGGLVIPFVCTSPAGSAPGDGAEKSDIVSDLITRAHRTNVAFINGDMSAWIGYLGPIPPDFTLMQPIGGLASRGFQPTPERLEEMARYYRQGTAVLEVVETYASADLVVLVLVEQQHALIGGLPEQDWSLRVTLVYRRNGDVWEMVHRHADPLVRTIGLEWTAALARGALAGERAPHPGRRSSSSP